MTYVSALNALADGSRRKLLDHLRQRPHAVGELATAMRLTQPAISQHLRVLEHARLVTARREGRRRIYTLSTDGLGELRQYLESFWADVLTAFSAGDPAPPPREARSSQSRRRPRRLNR